MANQPEYSIIIPVHNEQEVLPLLRDRLLELLTRLDGDAEVIMVDDGSTDGSYPMLRALSGMDGRFKVIHFARNFGHQMAITAGMDLASGHAVVVMDADLQDPPEVVLEMAAKWREGYEIVYGVRTDRSCDSWFKRSTAKLFYRLLGRLSEVDIPAEVGDFRLVDRRAVEAFKSMREGSRYVRGMFAWMGFKQIGVPYARQERAAGATKYPMRKMLRLATDGVVGFSRVPLRLVLQTGLLVAAGSLMLAVAAVGLSLSGIYLVPGWASVVVAVTFLGGTQLAVMGMIGEYLGRTYEEAVGRPLYVVSALHGLLPPMVPPRRAVLAEPHSVIDLDRLTSTVS
jgi:glycosyltransferase involved in cell wall biosynthesis